MAVDEQKMLGQFLRLALPRFLKSLGDDTFKFLRYVRKGSIIYAYWSHIVCITLSSSFIGYVDSDGEVI